MATNLVVIEAKGRNGMSEGEAQCLGYMAMIHHVRKMENRLDTVVYGCVSDGFIFTFLRIDNSDKYSIFQMPMWTEGLPSQRIYTHLRHILRHAAAATASGNKRKVKDLSSTQGTPVYRVRIGSSTEDDAEDSSSLATCID
ncbi:hypothetical protein VTN96DRAFT_2724 [Rasamsonia emersonii]